MEVKVLDQPQTLVSTAFIVPGEKASNPYTKPNAACLLKTGLVRQKQSEQQNWGVHDWLWVKLLA